MSIFIQRLLAETYDVQAANEYIALSEFPIAGEAHIKTTGSSVTTDAVVVSSAPFKYLAIGDVLHVQTESDTVLTRTIVTKPSNDQVTVDSAWNIENGGAGRSFRWRDQDKGTAATSGLVNVAGWQDLVVGVTLEALNGTNVIFDVQGIVAFGTTPVILKDWQDADATRTLTATGTTLVHIATPVDSLRVGFRTTGDTGLNLVTCWVGGRRDPN